MKKLTPLLLIALLVFSACEQPSTPDESDSVEAINDKLELMIGKTVSVTDVKNASTKEPSGTSFALYGFTSIVDDSAMKRAIYFTHTGFDPCVVAWDYLNKRYFIGLVDERNDGYSAWYINFDSITASDATITYEYYSANTGILTETRHTGTLSIN